MSARSLIFASGEIYHVCNRSIAKEEIFRSKYNLRKTLEIIDFYRFFQRLRLSKFKTLSDELKSDYLSSIKKFQPMVEIYTFVLMPNHFHFLLKQNKDRGVSRFISNFQNSFAKVFNLKNDRQGSLFQRPFKAKRI